MGSSTDLLLVAVLVVLVAVVIYQARRQRDGFRNVPDPYALENDRIDEIRGIRSDGYDQPALYNRPGGIEQYLKSSGPVRPEEIAAAARVNLRTGTEVTPERISAAEREDWYAAGIGPDDPAAAQSATENFTGDTPAGDYGGYISDLMLDPQLRESHKKWVNEILPFSGTAMAVDGLDMEPTIDFIGLRRPQPVAVHNPLQLTEIGSDDLSGNKPFNFQGCLG
jgi:hypothetical protein